MRDTAFADELQLEKALQYVRRDHGAARRIYRAQAIQRAFGPRAARVFMSANGIAPALAERIMSATEQSLRR